MHIVLCANSVVYANRVSIAVAHLRLLLVADCIVISAEMRASLMLLQLQLQQQQNSRHLSKVQQQQQQQSLVLTSRCCQ
jgi:cytochrome c biogenesis factor